MEYISVLQYFNNYLTKVDILGTFVLPVNNRKTTFKIHQIFEIHNKRCENILPWSIYYQNTRIKLLHWPLNSDLQSLGYSCRQICSNILLERRLQGQKTPVLCWLIDDLLCICFTFLMKKVEIYTLFDL